MDLFIDGVPINGRSQVDQATIGALRNIVPNSGYWTNLDGITCDHSEYVQISRHPFWRNNSANIISISNGQRSTDTVSVKFPRFDITHGQKFSLNIAAFEDFRTETNNIKLLGRSGGSNKDFEQEINITGNIQFSPSELEFKHFTFDVPTNIDNGYIQMNFASKDKTVAFYLAYFSIIQGDVTTHEWTPAVEDMATKKDIASLQDQINQLKSKLGG